MQGRPSSVGHWPFSSPVPVQDSPKDSDIVFETAMKKNTIRITLILSLLLHVASFVGAWFFKPGPSSPFASKRRTAEVELLSPEELLKQLNRPQEPKGQIVDQSEKSVNEEVPKDSKYLSRRNQTVEKETRAALTGKFQNARSMTGMAKPPTKPGAKTKPPAPTEQKQAEAKVSPEKKAQPEIASNKNGAKMLPSLDSLKPKFNQYQPPAPPTEEGSGGSEQASATDDHVKAVTGLQTMLNTREFVYFSYYNRIKDRLRQYWEPKIKEKIVRILRQGRTIASSNDKITKVVIFLDRNGTLVRVQVVGASGVNDLDDAAVEAFRAAAPFPNPPRGIIEDDGMIRIRWDFILEASVSDDSRFAGAA